MWLIYSQILAIFGINWRYIFLTIFNVFWSFLILQNILGLFLTFRNLWPFFGYFWNTHLVTLVVAIPESFFDPVSDPGIQESRVWMLRFFRRGQIWILGLGRHENLTLAHGLLRILGSASGHYSEFLALTDTNDVYNNYAYNMHPVKNPGECY